jgi:uncharacterized protein YndB with AHSA1/START domain
VSNEQVVRESIDIKASPDRVWQVFTQPEYTKQFMFGCEAISDWHEGSKLEWRIASNGVVAVKGNIVAIDAPRLLRYTTFGPNSGYQDDPANYLTVTVELTPANGGTRFEVSQGDFALIEEGTARYDDSLAGWRSVLPKIKELAESSD